MKLPAEKTVFSGFALALLLLSIIGTASYRSIVQLSEDMERVNHDHEILVQLGALLSAITDAESYQRGYIITGDDSFLELYKQALNETSAGIQTLYQLTVDNPEQKQRVDTLASLTGTRLDYIQYNIDLRREQGFDVAQKELSAGKGKQIHDHIRRVVAEMEQVEQTLLRERRARVTRITQFTYTVILVGGILAFTVTGFALVLIHQDMKQRRLTEARLRDALLNLEAAKERAESADRLKSAFLATMSHELRTPLNSIIGFTGVILQELPGSLNAEQKKQLGMVRDSARHLLALINDVLDISKIEADQIEFQLEPFDLRVSISKVTDSVRPLAVGKGLSFEVEIMPAVGEIVSDKRRVEQILLNLLSNAIKFTGKGGVTLRADIIRDNPVESGNPMVCVTVTDTGTGIKAEDMDKLFKPFSQIDTGLSRNYEGTGLGLAICKKIVEKLGGSINITSEWDRGSEFILTLPVNRST